MDVSGYNHSDSATIAVPPEEVYAIISDVTRIGELSPVCKAGAWDDPAQAGKEGAWFTGHNVINNFSWDTHCKVDARESQEGRRGLTSAKAFGRPGSPAHWGRRGTGPGRSGGLPPART